MADDLLRQLAPTATTQERVRALLAVGVHAADIASVVGVSVSAIRNWSAGIADPRPESEIALDYLRAVTKVLLEGGIEPERVPRWLNSLNPELDEARPLEVLPEKPLSVLAAAHREVLELEQVGA